MIETNRINAYRAAPEAMRALQSVDRYLQSCGLEPSLVELVKVRASQINGCAFCIDLHSRAAKAAGESDQRLLLLDAWSESWLYRPRERAALEWTDAITRISENRVPQALFEATRAHFSEKELVDLTTLIGLVNAWNRLATAFRYRHG